MYRMPNESSSSPISVFRGLARDYERPDEALEGLQDVAFHTLMLYTAAPISTGVHHTLEAEARRSTLKASRPITITFKTKKGTSAWTRS
jgi:hypothetical protein